MEAMAAPDKETFEQLLIEIKKLNKNLESSSFAINNMTMQLNSLDTSNLGLDILFQNDSAINVPKNPKASKPSIDSSAGGDNVTNTVGYINWNASHNIIKSQRLIQMHSIRNALKKLQSVPESSPVVQNTRAITSAAMSTNTNGFFTFQNIIIPVVNEEVRFPQGAVYVDVNSEQIKKEMEFLNKLNVAPTAGVVDRFLKIVEKEMHTCSSFEKLHGLKWV